MNIPDKLRSNIIGHNVDLHRFEAGLQAKIREMIDALGEDLVKELLGAGLDTPRTDWQRARLRALLNDVQAMADKAYGEMANLDSSERQALVEVTGDAIVMACNDAIGAKIMVPIKWTPELLAKLADDTLIHGAPSSEWWSRQASDLTEAFADHLRQGMLRGETLTQLRDRILGLDLPGVEVVGKVDLRSVQPNLRSPIWAARRNAEALIRTSVISTANAAHMEVYAANADIMEGMQWCSTLDTRTCLVAGTPVSTPTGTTPIDKLKSGDLVIGGSGKPRRVLGVMNRKTVRTVKVTLSNGETIRCTEDHPWLDFDQKWVEAKDLKPGDSLAFALK